MSKNVLTGEKIWLDNVRKKDITLFVDMDGFEEEGEYTVFLDCDVTGSDEHDFTWTAAEDEIEITLTPKD